MKMTTYRAILCLASWLFAVACAALSTPQDRPLRIFAFGDSTTATRETVGAVYAQRLPQLLAAEAIDATVWNSGLGGSHSGRRVDNGRHKIDHALDRLNVAVRAGCPDVVVIQFGINDSWIDSDNEEDASRIPLSEYAWNLREIVLSLQGDGATTILMTPGLLGSNLAPWRDARLATYADAVQKVAQDTDSPFVDVRAIMGRMPSVDELLLDGTHPNDVGHMLVAEALTQLIAELERKGELPRREESAEDFQRIFEEGRD